MIDATIKSLAQPLDPVATNVDAKLPKLQNVRAVLFDVYGTLLISGSGDIGVATQSSKEVHFVEALRAAGQTYLEEPQHGLADFHDAIAAEHETLKKQGTQYPEVRIDEIWARVIKNWDSKRLTEEPYSADRTMQLAIEYEMRVNPVWPMPAVVETLDALKAAGLTLGIVSNAQAFTPQLFEPLTGRTPQSLGFVDDLCFWSYQHRYAKPGTRLYEEAAEVLAACGLSAATTLYVGNDMRNDIWPAAAVGFQTALFAGDARSLRLREDDPEVANTKPTAIITSLNQILEIVGV